MDIMQGLSQAQNRQFKPGGKVCLDFYIIACRYFFGLVHLCVQLNNRCRPAPVDGHACASRHCAWRWSRTV
jgi:hypothetical protein